LKKSFVVKHNEEVAELRKKYRSNLSGRTRHHRSECTRWTDFRDIELTIGLYKVYFANVRQHRTTLQAHNCIKVDTNTHMNTQTRAY